MQGAPKRSAPTCLLLLVLALAQAAALILFLSGFLLSRIELPHTSRCSDWPASNNGNAWAPPHAPTCWLPRQFDRAVIVFIDALRYDFVTGAKRGAAVAPAASKMPRLLALAQTAVRGIPPCQKASEKKLLNRYTALRVERFKRVCGAACVALAATHSCWHPHRSACCLPVSRTPRLSLTPRRRFSLVACPLSRAGTLFNGIQCCP